ncbi:MAG: YceI family protein [Proteobacteria bacterium]|jgi:polyisoprenoid-binding protein YceI|nr:YceI family protein [Pseudomonadota bacterium]
MLKSMTMFQRLIALLCLVPCLVLSGPVANADWVLDSDGSTLNFSSIKNGAVVEPHLFAELGGKVDSSGAARVEVTLGSVDTMIPIRDERLREILFEVTRFPMAVFETEVPAAQFIELAVGESVDYQLQGKLNLHGAIAEVSVPVRVTKTGATTVSVSSQRPLVVSAGAFGLVEGLEALRKIAGLDAITPMVPVSFSLVFVRDSMGY